MIILGLTVAGFFLGEFWVSKAMFFVFFERTLF
jgi:hypothetical protein